MVNFAPPPSQAHMNQALNHHNALTKPPRHPLPPSRLRSGTFNMKGTEPPPNIYPCESTTTGGSIGTDTETGTALPPMPQFYSHEQSSILHSPTRDMAHQMAYGRPPPNPVYGHRVRIPSRVMPQPIHMRRPSYVSQAGSDYGYPPSPSAASISDAYGRVTYTPGGLTPKGGNNCVNSPWLIQNHALGDVLVECVDCGIFVGRSGALLFFFMMFNVRHRLKILPADTDLRKRKETLRLKKGGLPLPQWPVCYCNNLAMIEPNAILRFLAARLGQYGNSADPFRDYQADMILDKLAYWRDTLSTLIGEHPECVIINNNCDSPGVDEYLKTTRRSFLHQFETLLEVSDSDYFLGDTESWVDPVVFSVLFDDATFVWSVMTDRARMRERSASAQGNREHNEENEAWRAMSKEEFERERRMHEHILDEYPRCQQLINACLLSSPSLARWIKEHRNLWCGEKAPVATELVNRLVDNSSYYRKSYLPIYPNSTDIPM